MKTWQAVVPVAFVAILSGLALRPQPRLSVQPAEVIAASDSGRGHDSRAQAEEELSDTLDVLATSMGVRIDADALRWRARRHTRKLLSGEPLDDDEWVFLRTFFQLRIRRDAPFIEPALDAVRRLGSDAAASDSVRKQAGQVIKQFLDAYFNRDALWLEHPDDEAKLLAEDFDRLDRTDLKLQVLHQTARERKIDVAFLIATLPDPIDSYTGWQFDPMLDAITQAVAASDYVLDRFHFPDSDPPEQEAAHPEQHPHRRHLDEPAVVIFRRHTDGPTDGSSSSDRLAPAGTREPLRGDSPGGTH